MMRNRKPARRRVTMQDIADHVGVSSITVSRALKTPESSCIGS
ncbi:LacI family DNA-binding transcriptional regulator [Pseudomonas asuensis]